MAFDLTNNEEWMKEYNKQMELEKQKNMSSEEKARLFKQMLGGNK